MKGRVETKMEKSEDRILEEAKENDANEVASGFYVRGRYQIITMDPKPEWVPTNEWLKMRREGKLADKIRSISPVHENLIMLDTDVGLNLFLQHLSGDDTFPLELTTASIGTGTTPPSDSDTDLETPVTEDIPRAIGEITDPATFYSEWFISNDELPNDEYTEFGLFAGTQIFCRSLIESPTHTKSDNEDTLIVYSIIASNQPLES